MDSAMARRSIATHLVFAGVALAVFVAYFSHIPARLWQNWHAKDEFFVFTSWLALYALVGAVWLVVALCKSEFKRWLVGILACSMTSLLTLVLYPRVTNWYCLNVSMPTTAEIARILQSHRSDVMMAVEQFSHGDDSLSKAATGEPAFCSYSIRGVTVIPLPVGEVLTRAGVTTIYARPSLGWIWMTTWVAGEYLPPREAGLVFHRDLARPTLDDVRAVSGSDLTSLNSLEDHWSVYTAWNVYR